jgi:hypothetical protein
MGAGASRRFIASKQPQFFETGCRLVELISHPVHGLKPILEQAKALSHRG